MYTDVQVNLSHGTIIGLKTVLPNGDPYYIFKGIPYAEPPVNELRFLV